MFSIIIIIIFIKIIRLREIIRIIIRVIIRVIIRIIIII